MTPSDFNPRSPRGERHFLYFVIVADIPISIHAPLAGSDRLLLKQLLTNLYFNPRSPRGERL